MIRLILLAILVSVIFSIFKERLPDFLTPVVLAGTLVILRLCTPQLVEATSLLSQLMQRVDEPMYGCLFRAAGILLAAEYGQLLCKDAGAEALSWCVGFAGRCMVLSAGWPLVESLCRMIWSIS